VSWPCGRHPQPKPDSHRRRHAPRGEERRRYRLRLRGRPAIPNGVANRLAAARPTMPDRPPGIPSPCRANPTRDGRLRPMTRTKRADAARERGELSHHGVGRRLWAAIDARRRLNADRQRPAGTSSSLFGTRDPPLRLPRAAPRLEAPSSISAAAAPPDSPIVTRMRKLVAPSAGRRSANAARALSSWRDVALHDDGRSFGGSGARSRCGA
jgi:hypothetical protein